MESMPHRYSRDTVGRWRCPPGEFFAEQFGLFYRLRSSAEIDWVLQRNLRFLEDYLASEPSSIDGMAAESIIGLIAQEPGLQLDELVGQLGETHTDEIYTLIAGNRIYVDLHAVPLAEPERVRLFRDEDTARAYTVVATAKANDGGMGADAT